MTHSISTGTAQPTRMKPYRIPIAYREKVEQELLEMELGEEVLQQMASLIVVVTKKDGSLWICVDYRRLNQVTVFNDYPMPRVDELLDATGGAAFITTLDLAKGYCKVPMTEMTRQRQHLPHLTGYTRSLWCLLGYVDHLQCSRDWWRQYYEKQRNSLGCT